MRNVRFLQPCACQASPSITPFSRYGARNLRLYNVSHFSVHELALVDAPAFHFTLDTCDSGEVYNILIRGGNMGGFDRIDVWSTNIWIHDLEVTNKVSMDESAQERMRLTPLGRMRHCEVSVEQHSC